MKHILVAVLVVIICCAALPVGVSSQSSANYNIIGGDLNSGGGVNMTSSSYRNSLTFGQSSPIGIASSASYQMQMGVQYIYHAQTPAPANSYLLWTK